MRRSSPRWAEHLPADQLKGSGLPATGWPRKQEMRGVGLQRKVLECVNDRLGGEKVIEENRLVLLKPNAHGLLDRTMVFELCERRSSLSVQALGTVTAEFHEDARTASLAADAVSLAVERFQVSAVGALVVNEFNHTSLSSHRDLASCFEPFIGQCVPVQPRRLGRT